MSLFGPVQSVSPMNDYSHFNDLINQEVMVFILTKSKVRESFFYAVVGFGIFHGIDDVQHCIRIHLNNSAAYTGNSYDETRKYSEVQDLKKADDVHFPFTIDENDLKILEIYSGDDMTTAKTFFNRFQ